jgi:hypothetical protein
VKLQVILVALVIGLMGFAAPSTAQRSRGSTGGGYSPLQVSATGANAGDKYQDLLYGVVKELNKDAMVLTKTQYGKSQYGTDQTFKFNKKTKFIHDGKGSSLKSLQLGDKVWVDVHEDKKTGDLIARKVVTGVFVMSSN